VTVYGGTDYDVANAAISLVSYSVDKAPFGFPTDTLKWSVIVTDSSLRTQATPTNSTIYNTGSISITVPIGCWQLNMKALASATRSVAGFVSVSWGLGTANNTLDGSLTYALGNPSTTNHGIIGKLGKLVTLTSKTVYYANHKCNVGGGSTADNLYFENNGVGMVIEAICQYL